MYINIPVEQLNNVLLPLPNLTMKRMPGNHDRSCSCHISFLARTYLSLQIQPPNAMDNHLFYVRRLYPRCTLKEGSFIPATNLNYDS